MSTAPPWRFIRLNSLSPRDQIRYFYLTTARRAGDKGLPRGKPETPAEYSQNLKDNWPDLSDDIDGLTSAFLEARYSSSSIEESDAEDAKPFWKRIRQVLRR
jgi:hypothetical protein